MRTIPTRRRDRARYDDETVHAILDEGLVCQLGFVADGAPRVLPTIHARLGHTLYLHGSTGSRPLREAAEDGGLAVCVTVTLVDGLVFARSAFDHSVNYRSVVAHSVARLVTDPAEKRAALDALVEHVAAGRAGDCRPPSAKELAATAVLALPLDEVSAKVRTGPAGDDPVNGDAPYWAGVLPLRTVADAPEPDPASAAPTPAYLANYRRNSERGAVGSWSLAPRSNRSWWEPAVMEGQHVRLEPLGPEHVDGLFAAGSDPEVWRWLSTGRPRTRDEMAEVVAQALHAVSRGERVCWVQIDRRTGEVAGTTSYYEVMPAARHVAIGHTWLGRPWWRTALNTEAKLLLLERAFDTLGALRVTWHTDLRNERSQAAIARLGAVREGVLRHHRIRPDGTLRDTVVFSMIADEWPAASERLRGALLFHEPDLRCKSSQARPV